MIKKERSLVSKNSNSLNVLNKGTSMTSNQIFRNKRIPIVISTVFAISILLSVTYAGIGYSEDGPKPWSGHKKDTIIWHIQPENGANASCGGKSLHIGADITNPGQIVNFVNPTNVTVSMKDWDGTLNGGNETKTIDCDSRDGDGKVSFQIADHDPRKGWVTTSDWFMRLVGIPEQNFTATTYANHTLGCAFDEGLGEFICDFDIIKLAHIDLAQISADADPGDPCKDAFKQKGNSKNKPGSFCDVTSATEVDVTLADDTLLTDIQIFRVSCVDTTDDDVDETLDVCPLGSSIWEINKNTGRPTIQMFIVHSDEGVKILEGKKIHKGCGKFKGC